MLESVLAVLLALILAQLIATLESMLVVLLDGGIIGRDSATQRLYMYWTGESRQRRRLHIIKNNRKTIDVP